MRLRTNQTDLNGTTPHLEVPGVFNNSRPQHIVVTYDYSVQVVHVDGKRRATEYLPGGRFSNWDPSYRLILGNEATGDRPWLGKIYYVAIYDRALGKEKVRKNFLAGRERGANSVEKHDGLGDSRVVEYLFDEGEGGEIRDTGGLKASVDLSIPEVIRTLEKHYLKTSFDWFSQKQDIMLNVLGFIPFGLLLHATIRTRWEQSFKSVLLVLLAGALFTFSIESLQHFSLTRHSSAIDMGSNILGALAGIVLDRGYARKLRNRTMC